MKKYIKNNKMLFINLVIIATVTVIALVANFTLGLFDSIPESGGFKGAVQYIGETASYWVLIGALIIAIGSSIHLFVTLSKARKNRISFEEAIDNRIAKAENIADKITGKVSSIKTAIINFNK